MNFFKIINYFFLNRRDKRAERLSEEYTDILILQKLGIIRARATGQTITDINALIESRVRVEIKVLIPHGTYFISRGSHQNMVTRKEYRFKIYPLGTEFIKIPASCINANLPIPTGKDRFKGVGRVSKNLEEFLKAATNEDAMTIQAGVWAITDKYDAYQIKQKLIVFREPGFGRYANSFSRFSPTESAISDHNINRAREILYRLNIYTRL